MSFKRLDPEDFVVSADSVQSTAWSTGLPALTAFFTSTEQQISSAGNYYISVYQSNPASDDNASVQFDVAYGNIKGSGSTEFNSNFPGKTPSSAIYGSYRSLVLEDENQKFTFGDSNNSHTPDDIWVISVDRARYKEKLFPGTFLLKLDSTSTTLTDNSQAQETATFIGSNRVYQIIEGSDGKPSSGTGFSTSYGSYGLYLPDIGTIILNPDAINEKFSFSPNRGSNIANNTNPKSFIDQLNIGQQFTLNSEETITSDYIFVRSRNSEFNYSTNPSFISGSTGELIYPEFINSPQVYVTTVGMYNDANELMAVAKLSKPLLKDFTKESLVRVKLDF